MAFYDGLGKRMQQGDQGAIDRIRKGAEVARLNSSINGVEKEAAKKYEELGRAYYEKYAANDTYDNDMDPYFQDIDALMDKIEEYKDQIRTLEGIRKCPECGQDVSAAAQFCSFCGAKLEPVVSETTDSVMVCPNCGATLEENQVFCTVCGTNVENAASLEKKSSRTVEASAQDTRHFEEIYEEETSEEALEPELVEEVVVKKILVCPNCGAELDEDAVFCTVCGQKVG